MNLIEQTDSKNKLNIEKGKEKKEEETEHLPGDPEMSLCGGCKSIREEEDGLC